MMLPNTQNAALDILTTKLDNEAQDYEPSLPTALLTKKWTENDDEVVELIAGAWDISTQYYGYTNDITSLVINFYNGQIPPHLTQVQNPNTGEWVEMITSKARIGWTNRGINQLADEITSAIFQNPGFFSIGPTAGSEYAIAVCEKLVTSLLHNAGIKKFSREALQTWFLFGEVGLYISWADNALDTLALERLPYKDIRHIPATLPKERAMLAFTRYCTKAELTMAEDGQYYNVGELPDPPDDSIPRNNDGTTLTSGFSSNQGYIVKTIYIPEMTVSGKTYINSIAVIADGKFLIQFKTGLSKREFLSRPHIRAVRELYVDAAYGPVTVGQSIAHQAIDIELAAFTIHNLVIDSSKVNVHPPKTYEASDAAFKKYVERNPLTAFAPAALIPKSNQNNQIVALTSGAEMLTVGIEILQRLEQEFILSLGIPSFNGGVGTDDRRVTATAKQQQGASAAVRTKALTEDANEQIVLPLVHHAYSLVAKSYNAGALNDLAQAIAPVEHNLARQEGQMAPLLNVEQFRMSVYEAPTARADRLQAYQLIGNLLPQALQLDPNLLNEANLSLSGMLRQMMRDLGIEPESAPAPVGGPPVEQPANPNGAMASIPPNASTA